jgi:hypothetical protein
LCRIETDPVAGRYQTGVFVVLAAAFATTAYAVVHPDDGAEIALATLRAIPPALFLSEAVVSWWVLRRGRSG